MQRVPVTPRDDWKQSAQRHGFTFHTINEAPYWDETAYYRLTLRQIEDDIEAPTAELEQLCLSVVERAAADEEVLARLAIPEPFWGALAESWRRGDRNLYGRMDLSYDGSGPAKLLEYNADTPTALYESAIFQWEWLETAMQRDLIPAGCDQFNSLHERLVEAFARFGIQGPLHLTCARDSEEDRGTVAYLEDCARQGGLKTYFLFIDEIGIDAEGWFTDIDDTAITTLFKLYPWEWMMAEEFGRAVPGCRTQFIEPLWKAVLSNKGLLALLWEMYEGHPNLLPTYFAGDPTASGLGDTFVQKPLLSREGNNVRLVGVGAGLAANDAVIAKDGPYGAEGHVVQAYHPLPAFDGNYPMLGSWVIASQPAGLCVREDASLITTDTARFLPHVILD